MKSYSYIYLFFILLLTIGSVFVYSSSSFIGYIYYNNSFIFYIKQMIAIVLGIFLTYITMHIPSSFFKKQAVSIFFFIVFLNILPFFPFIKYPINGAMRWVSFYGIIFQPSELLKFSFFLNLSFIFSFYQDQIQYILSLIFFYFLLTTIILINQSDFGLIVIFSIITFILLWNFLYNKKILFYGSIFIFLLVIILIIIKPYRILRLLSYLNPWTDPLGRGFQIIQSHIAIANGKFWGLGLGLSKQKNLFLPMAHTDFIFSIIIEEIGLIGGFFILYLLFKFSFFFIKESSQTTNIFKKNYLLCTGLLIIIQTCINVGAATAILPTKGIGLPLISYGMSSILSFSILIGIALSMIKN
jgi:cell division protein FtsW